MDEERAQACASLVRKLESKLRGPGADEARDRLEAAQPDLHDAIRWFLDHDREDEALALGAGLWPYWMDRGHIDEGRRLLTAALEASCARTAARARALAGAGVLAFRQGDNDAARALHDEALAVARETADRDSEARALGGLARVAMRDEDFDGARALATASVDIFRETGNEFGEASSLHVLAYVTMLEGHYERARPAFQESLALNERLGDRLMVAIENANLGQVERHLGHLDRAEELYLRSLRMAAEMKNT
jgi:tetratricopeptide (TPR) repeat protein